MLALAACSSGFTDVLRARQARETLYVPPTALAAYTLPAYSSPLGRSDSDEVEAQTEAPPPAPTPSCEADLSFIQDVTIPDGTSVEPGAVLDKRWQVENSGSCNWDRSYRLKLIAGADLGAPAEQALYPARSDTQAVIRVIFTAPQEPGVHRSAWQAHTPAGEPFGDMIFIEIIVTEPS